MTKQALLDLRQCVVMWQYDKDCPAKTVAMIDELVSQEPAASGEPACKVTVVDDEHPAGIPYEQWVRPKATAQPAPALVPLTDEQALEIAVTATPPGSMASRHQIVEAIRLAERHHGIFPSKENPL